MLFVAALVQLGDTSFVDEIKMILLSILKPE
jgi:hypothetical protein